MTGSNHLFVLSFTAGAESGLALVAACSGQEALQVLRKEGKNKEVPTTYEVKNIKDLGVSTTLKCGLLMESYVNALAAWDLIEEKFNLICNCDGDTPSPSPSPSPDVDPTPDYSEYVKRDELDAYVTLVQLTEALNRITVTGGGEMNVIEGIYVNSEKVNPVNRNVSLDIPTKVSQLRNDLDFATKSYVESYVESYWSTHQSGGDSGDEDSGTPVSGPVLTPIIQTTNTSQALAPNKYYVWTSPVTSMAFTLDTTAEIEGYICTYNGEFTVGSGGMTSFTVPTGVVIADQYFYELTAAQYFHPLATYQFSIVRNVMSIYSSYVPQ